MDIIRFLISWNTTTIGRTTNLLWGNVVGEQTKSLLRLGKRKLGDLVMVIAGERPLSFQLQRLGKAESARCRAGAEDIQRLRAPNVPI